MKIRDYRGLLAVFVAAALGISLLCSVSGMAIQDLNESAAGVDLAPADIVDAAVSNLNTVGALTMQAFAELIPTSTPTRPPTITSSPTATIAPITPTAFRFPTVREPTRTRRPRPDPTNTPVPPTRTAIPPTRTNTPVPPTDIPPSPTDTLEPTNTVPPPTITDEPTIEPSATVEIPITGATPTP